MVPNGITAATYTPLESLLFFQALRAQDLSAINFQAVSSELEAVPLVKQDATFDHDRLTPGALQELYSSLVQHEAGEYAAGEAHSQASLTNGHATVESRKRKALSSQPPSIELAVEHVDFFPGILLKLYAKYRASVIAAVTEEERRIAVLQGEIAAIEDDVVHGGAAAGNRPDDANSNAPLPIGEQQAHDQLIRDPAEGHTTRRTPDAEPDTQAVPFSVNTDPVVLDDVVHGSRPRTTSGLAMDAAPSMTGVPAPMGPPSAIPSPQQRQTTLPSLSQIPSTLAQTSPHGPAPRTTPSHIPQPETLNDSSHFPITQLLPQGRGNNVRHSPTLTNGFPLPIQPTTHRGMQSLPHQYNPTVPQQTPGHSKQAGRGHPAASPHYAKHHSHTHPQPQRAPPLLPQPQQDQPRPSQLGGVQLPPFSVSAQEPIKVHHQVHQRHASPSPSHAQEAQSSPHRTPLPNTSTPLPSLPSTPQALSTPRESVDNPELVNSVVANLRKRRSTSTWRHLDTPPLFPPRSPPRPAIESISPVKTSTVRPSRVGAEVSPEVEDDDRVEELVDKERLQHRKTTRRTRGSSMASSPLPSATRGRTRSQSVVSQLDTQATPAEMPVESSVAKQEPSTAGEHIKSTESVVSRSTRARRGTPQAPLSLPTSQRRTPRGMPRMEALISKDQVMATRNFQRLSAVILNEISAHRHAGPFQKPVSSRDVEGYADIIKMPQDLKSIKAAISAGSRAVNAAVAAGTVDEDVGTGTSIVLPRSEALSPPKGIVNSAQLEQEVMRMFANAVLFNPGNEGFVQDARDMAEDVASKIQNWRGIESSGGDRAEDDGLGGGGGKRRKV